MKIEIERFIIPINEEGQMFTAYKSPGILNINISFELQDIDTDDYNAAMDVLLKLISIKLNHG